MNPLDYIWIALVMTFCTLSVYNLTREGQLFFAIRCFIEAIVETLLHVIWYHNKTKRDALFKIINKPLFACPPCMASVWGSTFYWFIFAGSIQEWIVCVLISSILNKIIYGYVE